MPLSTCQQAFLAFCSSRRFQHQLNTHTCSLSIANSTCAACACLVRPTCLIYSSTCSSFQLFERGRAKWSRASAVNTQIRPHEVVLLALERSVERHRRARGQQYHLEWIDSRALYYLLTTTCSIFIYEVSLKQ